jgi:hypothetical protein
MLSKTIISRIAMSLVLLSAATNSFACDNCPPGQCCDMSKTSSFDTSQWTLVSGRASAGSFSQAIWTTPGTGYTGYIDCYYNNGQFILETKNQNIPIPQPYPIGHWQPLGGSMLCQGPTSYCTFTSGISKQVVKTP